MEAEGIFHNKVDGVSGASSEWRERWATRIGLFGYQNGVPEERSAEFIASVFHGFESEIPAADAESEEIRLFQLAARILPTLRIGTEGALLKFEEDREIHGLLQKMEEHLQLAISLFYFHGKTIEEVAAIAGKSPEAVNDCLAEGRAWLTHQLDHENDERTVKRLELANKSYWRISFKEPEEKIEREEDQQPVLAETLPFRVQPEGKQVDPRNKLFLVVGGIFLAGVIGSTFFMEDPNSNVSSPVAEAEEGEIVTESMVEGWEEEYKKARKAAPRQLGVSPEVFEGFAYVKEADQGMKRTVSEKNIEKWKSDPKEMQRQVDLLMLKIETPKKMVANLPSLFLMGDELELLMDDYAGKTAELLSEGDQTLRKHQEDLARIKVNGEVSPEKLLMRDDNTPEQVKKLIESLPERGLFIAEHPKDNRFILRRDVEILYSLEQFQGMPFVDSLRYEPLSDEEGLLVPIEEMASILPMMEFILMEEAADSEEFQESADVFQHSFWLLLKGDSHGDVFDGEGIVKKEYQQAWTALAQGMNNPLIYVMLPVVEEMAASGWTRSASYEQLAYEDILQALMLEKGGALAEKMPNADVAVQTEKVAGEEFYTSAIEGLYASFAADYDKMRLAKSTPLDVFRVYQYANRQQDPVAMWHLMNEDKPPLEEYIRYWRQQPDFAEKIHLMEIQDASTQRVGRSLYIYPYINFVEEEAMMTYHPELVTTRDNIWEVQGHFYEEYELSEEGAAFNQQIEKLYAAFSENLDDSSISKASAGEIGGLFLLAAEQQNFSMVKALISETEEQPVTIIEAQVKSKSIPAFSSAQKIAFFNDAVHKRSDDYSVGTLSVEAAVEEEGELFFNQITMVRTPAGWRIGDLNTY